MGGTYAGTEPTPGRDLRRDGTYAGTEPTPGWDPRRDGTHAGMGPTAVYGTHGLL